MGCFIEAGFWKTLITLEVAKLYMIKYNTTSLKYWLTMQYFIIVKQIQDP